jgi:hypothetical protein
MMLKSALICFVGIGMAIGLFAGICASAAEAPRMTTEQLKARLDDPNVVIIDARLGSDWNDSNAKIKGAVRENPSEVSSWMSKYPKDKTLVFY